MFRCVRDDKGGINMDPMYISVLPKETGMHIKTMMKQNGITVRDVKDAMGFEQPQAVYKWLAGQSLPTLDNLVILSRILHVSIDEILILSDEDFSFAQIVQTRLSVDRAFRMDGVRHLSLKSERIRN